MPGGGGLLVDDELELLALAPEDMVDDCAPTIPMVSDMCSLLFDGLDIPKPLPPKPLILCPPKLPLILLCPPKLPPILLPPKPAAPLCAFILFI